MTMWHKEGLLFVLNVAVTLVRAWCLQQRCDSGINTLSNSGQENRWVCVFLGHTACMSPALLKHLIWTNAVDRRNTCRAKSSPHLRPVFIVRGTSVCVSDVIKNWPCTGSWSVFCCVSFWHWHAGIKKTPKQILWPVWPWTDLAGKVHILGHWIGLGICYVCIINI